MGPGSEIGAIGSGESTLGGRLVEALGAFPVLQGLLRHAREQRSAEGVLAGDVLLEGRLVDALIDCEIGRLLKDRNERMKIAEQPMTYEEAQYDLWVKRSAASLAGIIREVSGPYALLGEDDSRAPLGGMLEWFECDSLAAQHAGGSPDDHAADVAKALGLVWMDDRGAVQSLS